MIYVHDLTWPEVLSAARRGEAVGEHTGHLFCSKDRKLDPEHGFLDYLVALRKAENNGIQMPLPVYLAYYLERSRVKHQYSGKSAPSPLEWPVNPQGKRFSWSFSALNDASTCLAQYAARRFHETAKFTQNEANIWGDRVHKALEARLKDGTPLPDEMTKWEKLAVSVLANATKLGAEVATEEKIVLTSEFEPTTWFAKDAWYRGSLDVLLTAGEDAYIFDWKTSGKIGTDDSQLKLFAATTFLTRPEIQRIKTRYIWLMHGTTTGTEYTRDQAPTLWAPLLDRVAQLECSWVEEQFPCRTSGLCHGWCPATDCKHWKPKR